MAEIEIAAGKMLIIYLIWNDNTLAKVCSSYFSHDLMYTDFDKDGYFEVIDYFYDPGGQIEVCNLKQINVQKLKIPVSLLILALTIS